MKLFGSLTFAAISGVVLWKLLATILLPLLGTLIGLAAMTAKLALVVAVIFLIYSMMKKRKSEAEA